MNAGNRWGQIASGALLVAVVTASAGCFNDGHNVTIASKRFEVATGSVVLGARQLLVDTSNGDVWVLEGTNAPDARWQLLARGPEDARKPAKSMVPLKRARDAKDEPER